MAYILAVNPAVLGDAGMPVGAVYLATVIATVVGCLLLGLFANVPLAQSASLGLNTFFAYSVVSYLGFTWQEALSMVFICGILSLVITMTKLRTYLISSIPKILRTAIGCGIGLFIAYLGFKNVNFIEMSSGVPAVNWAGLASDPVLWLFLIGLVVTIILAVLKVKGAFLISIIATTLIGLIPVFGVTSIDTSISITEAFTQLPETLGVVFTSAGFPSLFADPTRIPFIILTILLFAFLDLFNTIGTIIGAGRETNLFSDEEIAAMKTGKRFRTRTERALIADAAATTVGAVVGTSNITTFVESAAGIGAGGRTGLTAVVTALCFAACILLVPFATVVPGAATAPVLILVGIMMLKPITELEWHKLEVAIPCFFSAIFMAFCYNITDGIAAGFLTYTLIKICKREVKEVHPSVWVVTALFVAYGILCALFAGG